MAYQTTGPSPIQVCHLCLSWQIEVSGLNISIFAATLEEAIAKFAVAFRDIDDTSLRMAGKYKQAVFAKIHEIAK